MSDELIEKTKDHEAMRYVRQLYGEHAAEPQWRESYNDFANGFDIGRKHGHAKLALKFTTESAPASTIVGLIETRMAELQRQLERYGNDCLSDPTGYESRIEELDSLLETVRADALKGPGHE